MLEEGGKNAQNDIMSVWQLETSLYRHGNFVIFRGTKKETKKDTFISLLLLI